MFFEEFLQDVRRERYSPASIALYVRRVARKVREEALANPAAARSLWITALGFFAGAFLVAALLALRADRQVAEDFLLLTSAVTLVTFGLTTLYLGLLRDPQGYALSALSVPCMLTLGRLVLLPGFVLFLLERRLMLALVFFVVAGLTDVADGWVARRFKQETRLGVAMDPIVDIVFNLTLFGALAAAELVPRWVWLAAVLRYGLLLGGGAYLYVFHGPVRIAPTVFGRLVGVVTAVLVGLLLVLEMSGGPAADRVAPLTRTALGVLLVGGFGQAVVMGWYNLRLLTGEARAARRVISDVRWGAQ
jgi:cardiolipin synthase